VSSEHSRNVVDGNVREHGLGNVKAQILTGGHTLVREKQAKLRGLKIVCGITLYSYKKRACLTRVNLGGKVRY